MPPPTEAVSAAPEAYSPEVSETEVAHEVHNFEASEPPLAPETQEAPSEPPAITDWVETSASEAPEEPQPPPTEPSSPPTPDLPLTDPTQPLWNLAPDLDISELGTAAVISTERNGTSEPAADLPAPNAMAAEEDTTLPPPFLHLLHPVVDESAAPPVPTPLTAKAVLDAIPEVTPDDFALLHPAPNPPQADKVAAEEAQTPPETPEPEPQETKENPAPPPNDWRIKI